MARAQGSLWRGSSSYVRGAVGAARRLAPPLCDGGAARLPSLSSLDLRSLPAYADGKQRRTRDGAAAGRGVPARAVGLPLPGGGQYGVLRERLAARQQAALVLCGVGRGGAQLPVRSGRVPVPGAGR